MDATVEVSITGLRSQKARRRYRLFMEQEGLCWWCRKPMVFTAHVHTPISMDECTIDHLHSWYSLRRETDKTVVGAHHECNLLREREETTRLPRKIVLGITTGKMTLHKARRLLAGVAA